MAHRVAGERLRHPGEVRRQLIVEVARRLIAERGLAATSVRTVAAACGLSSGTITYHFRSIDDILAAVLRYENDIFWEPLLEKARAERSARAALGILTDGLLGDGDDVVRHWCLWLSYRAAAAHDPRLAAWHAERYRNWHGTLQVILDRGVDRGELAVAGTRAAAIEVAAMLDGLVVQTFFAGSPLSRREGRELFRRLVADRLAAGDDGASAAAHV